ncbi:hypothetical protein WR25_24130 [Diploscapter pachys]|uniref:DUF19 domain-containing protein n=1 Tax=Diploscapter pachys TaxID=2018661 RepID=A0A2A2K1V9_9BILA|nr:hypothetical protein WR25_24130 [Diploscapter pachys]
MYCFRPVQVFILGTAPILKKAFSSRLAEALKMKNYRVAQIEADRNHGLISSSFATLGDECKKEEIDSIRQCYVPYLAGFNITLTNNQLPEYHYFHTIRMDWLFAGKTDAQAVVCTLGNALVACTQPFTCLGERTYHDIGLQNSSDALSWWQDLGLTQYQCGDGYKILMNNFDCITQAHINTGPQIQTCSEKAAVVIAEGKPFCEGGMQYFLNCANTVFTHYCNADVGVWFCNSLMIGIEDTDPLCKNKMHCPQPSI